MGIVANFFSSRRSQVSENFHYTNYPNRLNLHPESEDHNRLLSLILSYAKQAHDVLRVRHPSWAEIDNKVNVFIDLSTEEKEDQADDPRRPVSMVVPISYATRETLLTYRVAALLTDPINEYDWRDPRDALPVLLLEQVISQQALRKKMALDYYTMWMDEITYGFGGVVVEFETERVIKRKKKKGLFGQEFEVKDSSISYQGNTLFPIDPYNALPDPNVPITNVKDMQFFGLVERTNYYDLLSFEENNDAVFNVKYLKKMRRAKSLFYHADEFTTGRYDKTKVAPENQVFQNIDSRPIDVIWMYAKLIPKDFKLGKENFPRIWKFGVAGDRIIIYAKEVTDNHNRIPIATIATNSDGHSTIPTSLLEIEFPIQHAIDWLWGTHVIETRKHLNNMLVVDPSLINMNDITDTRHGMVARLRARAFGRGVKDAIMQLNVTDVTRSNIQDIGFLMGIDQRITAATDQMQGIQNRRGERVSAAEARDTRLSVISRLEKNARILGLQGHADIAFMLASNIIQYMEEDIYLKITGKYEDILREEYGITEQGLRVSPDVLDADFDVIINDGSIPGGEFANTWQQLLQMTAANPELFQRIDFVRTWLHIARLLGAKNPQDFLKKVPQQPRVASQEQIDKGIQQGNIITPQQFKEVANG